jgi:hypothetical protein
MKSRRPIIVPHGLGKSPTCRQLGTERRSCLVADSLGTNLRGGHPGHEQNKAFHNRALCAVAIPNWQESRGLCSNRAIEVSRQEHPETSLFLDDAFSLARQSNSLERPSQRTTLINSGRKHVFTLTQSEQRFFVFALAFNDQKGKTDSGMGPNENSAATPIHLTMLDERRLDFVWSLRKLFLRSGFSRWKQCFHIYFQGFCENDQFGVRHATKLRLDFRERAAAQVPAENGTPGGEHSLRQFLLIAQFSDLRADDVFRFYHAPKMELDTNRAGVLNCSIIGATRSTRMSPHKSTTMRRQLAGNPAIGTKPFEYSPAGSHPIVAGAPCTRLNFTMQ